MKDAPGLDDLALFLAVADSGGLAGAVRITGFSAPTLSRRMAALERQLGAHLFERGKRGYALTARGRALLDEAAPLRDLRARLAAFAAEDPAPRVRITAGTWTSRFIARNIRQAWTVGDPWTPAFLASNAMVDIARREADIGVRNRRPEQSWLAGRRTSVIDYAIYGTADAPTGFVTLPRESASTPTERWLWAHHSDSVTSTANTALLCLELALAGVGRMVLPCFAGDAEPGLVRHSDPLSEVRHEEWLVCHHDARHDPPVRRALDALADLLSAQDRASAWP